MRGSARAAAAAATHLVRMFRLFASALWVAVREEEEEEVSAVEGCDGGVVGEEVCIG